MANPAGGDERGPYASALDFPTIHELLTQINGMKTLTRIVGRKHRRDLVDLERQVRELEA